jgi:hypothetical protein
MINWSEIRKFLEDRADAEYVFSDIDCKPRPNSYMVALSLYEGWREGYPVNEVEVITEVLEILEDLPDSYEYTETISELNRRYFELTTKKEDEQAAN